MIYYLINKPGLLKNIFSKPGNLRQAHFCSSHPTFHSDHKQTTLSPAKSCHVNRLRHACPMTSRPAQTCPNPSFNLAGIPPWVLDGPWVLPSWTSDILAGTIKIPVAESFRHLKTYSPDYTKCSPGRGGNLSFFYFKNMAQEPTGTVRSRLLPPKVSCINSQGQRSLAKERV